MIYDKETNEIQVKHSSLQNMLKSLRVVRISGLVVEAFGFSFTILISFNKMAQM